MKQNGLKIYDKYQTPISTVRHMPLIKTETGFLTEAVSLTPKKMAVCAPLNEVSIKNTMIMNLNFTVLGHKKAVTHIINSPQSIWFATANINSEYEWYLQKSMIRNIYDMYYQFADFARKKTRFSMFNSIYGSYDNKDKQIEYFANLMLQKFVRYINRQWVSEKTNYTYPHPQLIIKNEGRQNSGQLPVIEHSHSENHIQVQKKVNVENLSDEPNIHNTIYNYVNIETVMEQVSRKIEKKLRHERLKKGY